MMVLNGLRTAGIDPLEALNFEVEDSDDDLSEEIEDEDSEAEGDVFTEANEPSSIPATESVAASESATEAKVEAVKPKAYKSHKPTQSTSSISAQLLDRGLLPFSLLSPDEHSLNITGGPVGRSFPWGFADPYNPEHCDFVKMRDACFRQWRADLREASKDIFYEQWRTSRLDRKPLPKVSSPPPVMTTRKSSGGIPIVLSGNRNF